MGASCVCNNATQLLTETRQEVESSSKPESISVCHPKDMQEAFAPEPHPVFDAVQLEPIPESPVKTSASPPKLREAPTLTLQFVPLTLDTLEPLEDGVPVKDYGPITMEDHTKYTGEWNFSGQRHGRGDERQPDGTVYIGHFQYDQRTGYGRLESSDGSVFQGRFTSGLPSGLGYFKHTNKSEYHGEFVNGLQHGPGKEVYPDGSWYEGNFAKGQKSGHGVFHWSTGKEYTGEFENDQMNGYGECVWPDLKSYSGPWKDGMMHGDTGAFQWPDGKKYQGQYKRNQKHGEGIFYWPNGRFYNGRWKNGVQHGEGVLMQQDTEGNYLPTRGRWAKGALVEEFTQRSPA